MDAKKPTRKKPRREVSVPLKQFGWTPEQIATARKKFGPERVAELAEQQRIADRFADRFNRMHSSTFGAKTETTDASCRAPVDVQPTPIKLEPGDWYRGAVIDYPRQPGEGTTSYANRLHETMQKAAVTRLWPWKTLRRRLYDKP
jgi:hypothetical protein